MAVSSSKVPDPKEKASLDVFEMIRKQGLVIIIAVGTWRGCVNLGLDGLQYTFNEAPEGPRSNISTHCSERL